MEGKGHLLSNHANIEAKRDNTCTIKHFLNVELFAMSRNFCLNLICRGQDVLLILSAGPGESLIV